MHLSIGIGLYDRDYCDKFSMVCNCCHWLVTMRLVGWSVFASQMVLVEAVVRPHIVFPNNNGIK